MSLIDWGLVVLIMILVIMEWGYERSKSGAKEATEKMLFGALMFVFFYGIMKSLWLLTIISVGILALLFSSNKKVGAVVCICTMLIVIVSYLAFRFSPWLFMLDFLIIVLQWFWSRRVIEA